MARLGRIIECGTRRARSSKPEEQEHEQNNSNKEKEREGVVQREEDRKI